ncbi:MAG: response regulator transcription factor [Chloroflexi bacterium]|nr:response regulator transcription factor [Chloroflexota bacterium]
MAGKTKVAILEDYQLTLDGYGSRLGASPEIEIVGMVSYGEEIEPLLEAHPADVVILDINVPTSPDNPNPYPITHVILSILRAHPNIAVLVVSMVTERSLIKAIMEAGANGYILKDDSAAIRELPAIVQSVAGGGIYLSQKAHQELMRHRTKDLQPILTPRQQEALALCAAYPDSSTDELAEKFSVTNSTVRNLLSGAYLRLGVHNRTAAITKARQLGFLTSLDTLSRS